MITDDLLFVLILANDIVSSRTDRFVNASYMAKVWHLHLDMAVLKHYYPTVSVRKYVKIRERQLFKLPI